MENYIFEAQTQKFENKHQRLTIDYFDIFRMLGEGDLSQVFLVQSKKKKKLYALKKIEKQKIFNQNLKKKIKKELECQMRYSFQNILKIYNHFEDDDYLYIIKEYAENGTLEQCLKNNRLSTKQKAKIIQDICKALQFIHQQDLKFNHLNLNMDNIYINIEYQAKLSQIGYYEAINSSIRSKLDKPNYLSPEILKGEQITPKSDVWAVGVILYKIFSNKFPFQPLDADEMSSQECFQIIKRNILKSKPENLRKFSPFLRKLLKQIFQKQIDKRISINDILTSQWIKDHSSRQNIFKRMVTSIKSKSLKKKILRNERESYEQQNSLSPQDKVFGSKISQHFYFNSRSNLNSLVALPIYENQNENDNFDSQIDESKVLDQIMNIKAIQKRRKDFYLQLSSLYLFNFFIFIFQMLEVTNSKNSIKNLKKNKVRNELLKIEEKLLTSQITNKECIKIKDCFINNNEYIHYVEINKSKLTNKNHLIMLHGFGANSSSFYKLISYLQDKFFITLLDLPGQGFSYPNPKLQNFKTIEQWLDYFCITLQNFFNKKNYKKFYLAGHSFGGYISAHYYSKFSCQILGLFLISPAGFNQFKDDLHQEHQLRIQRMPRIKRWIYKFLKERVYTQKNSPFDYAYQPFRYFIIKYYLGNQRFNFNSEERYLVGQLMNYFITKPQYSERCVGYCLQYSVQSKRSIIEELKPFKKQHKKIFIFYGDSDWMDSKRTLQILEQQKLDITVDLIPFCDHQIILQNPAYLSKLIIQYTDSIKNKEQLSIKRVKFLINVSKKYTYIFINTLGIDLGSEFIKAAYLVPGKQLTSVEDQMSNKLIDAVITFCNYDIYFEYKARQKQQKEECDSFYHLHLFTQYISIDQFEQIGYKNLKQDDIGILFPIRKQNIRLKESERYLYDEYYYLRQEEILALMFLRIYKYTENNSGQKIKNMSITIPNNKFSIQSRMKILSALKLAELKPQLFISQNSAAIFYHVFQNMKMNKNKNEFKIVLNVGNSGTIITLFKVYSLERQLRNKKLEYIPTIQVIKELYSTQFNGMLLDQCILNYIESKEDINITFSQKLKLLQKIKKIKKILSVNNEAKIDLKDINKNKKSLSFKKQQFYQECKLKFEIFEQILQNFKENIDKNIIDQVIDIELIGGITRIPKVKEITTKILQKKLSNHIDGNFASSFGSALSAVRYTDGVKIKEIILQENPNYDIEFEIEKDDKLKKIILFDVNSKKKKRIITLKDIKRNFNFRLLIESQKYYIQYRIKGVLQFLDKYHEKKIIENKIYLIFILNEFGIVELESVKIQITEEYIKKIQQKEIKKNKKYEDKLSYVIKNQSYVSLMNNIEEKKISLRRLFAMKQIDIFDMKFSEQKNSLQKICSKINIILNDNNKYLVNKEKNKLEQYINDCNYLNGLKVIHIGNLNNKNFKYMKLEGEINQKDFNEKQKLITTEIKKFENLLQKELKILDRRIILEKREQGVEDYAKRIINEFNDYIQTIQQQKELAQYYEEKYLETSNQQIKLIEKLLQEHEQRTVDQPQVLTYDSIGKNDDILDKIIEDLKQYKQQLDQQNEEL